MASILDDPKYKELDKFEGTGGFYEPSDIEEKPPTRLDAIGSSFFQENIIGSAANKLQDLYRGLHFNPDGRFDPADHVADYKTVSSDFWDELDGAWSEEEFQWKLKKYQRHQRNIDYKQSLGGFEAGMYDFSMMFLDVPFINGVTKLAKIGKLGDTAFDMSKSYIGRAALAGTTETGIEAFKQAASPEYRESSNMLYAAVLGSIMGGLYNPKVFDEDLLNVYKNVSAKHFKETEEAFQETLRRYAQAEREIPPKEAYFDMSTGTTKEKVAPEFAKEVEKVIDEQEISKVEQTLEDLQINLTSTLRKSDSPTIRNFIDDMEGNVLKREMDKQPLIQTKDYVEDAMTASYGFNYDQAFKKFLVGKHGDDIAGKLKGSTLSRRILTTEAEEFNKAAKAIHYIENEGVSPESFKHLLKNVSDDLYEDIKKANIKMSEESHDIMINSKHPLFEDGTIKKVSHYSPRGYNGDLMQADIAAGITSKENLVNAFYDGFKKRWADDKGMLLIGDQELKNAAEKMVERITQRLPTTSDPDFLIRASERKRTYEALKEFAGLTDEELELIDAARYEREAASGTGTARATKRRTNIDLNGSYTDDTGHVTRISDYLDLDTQQSWKSYARSMGGDSTLRNLGINSREELAGLYKSALSELEDSVGRLTPKAEKELNLFKDYIGNLLGVSSKVDPHGQHWKVARTLTNLTSAAKLGGTWFASAVEVAKVSWSAGFKNTMKAMPEVAKIFKEAAKGNYDDFAREVMLFHGLGTQGFDGARLAKADDLLTGLAQDRSSKIFRSIEGFSDKANEVVLRIGGAKTMQTFNELAFSAVTHRRFIDLVKAGNKEALYKYARTFEMSADKVDQYAAQIAKFSDADKNILNFAAWDDPALARDFSIMMRKASYNIVQRSTFGDRIAKFSGNKALEDSPLGVVMLSLKNYTATAYSRQLSRGIAKISRGGEEAHDVYGDMLYQMIGASLAYSGKQVLNFGNDKKELKKRLSLDKIITNSFAMSSFSSIIPGLLEVPAQVVFDTTLFNGAPRGDAAGFPSSAPINYLKDLYTGAIGVGKFVSPGASASRGELTKALGVLPFISTAPGFKMMTRDMAKSFAALDEEEEDE